MIPYPPIFKRTAAKIIDPSIGASTCAFGNQRWRRNKGILIKKAIIKRIGKLKKLGVNKFEKGVKDKIDISKGSDPKIV